MGAAEGILGAALKAMSEREIPLERIVVQKAVYFLQDFGVPLNFRFEPRTYGPYSAELANELHRLTFWSELAEEEHRYEIQDLHITQDAGVVHRIEEGLTEFTKLIHGKYDFDSVELFGTVLLCCRALQSLGEMVTAESVIGEFKGWKGEKYHEVRIKEAFSWVEPYVKERAMPAQ